MIKVSPASARDRDLYRCLGDGFGTELIQRLSHLGIRTVAKLVNRVAARIGRSLMVRVFSRVPSKPCSKTIVRMVLVAVVALPRSGGAGRLAGASGRLWSSWVKSCRHAKAAAPDRLGRRDNGDQQCGEPPNGASNRNRVVRSHIQSVDGLHQGQPSLLTIATQKRRKMPGMAV